MALLEHRGKHTEELGKILGILNSLEKILPEIVEKQDAEDLPEKDTIGNDIAELSKRVEQRLSRVRQNTCRVAVIGLEKAGKSTFINAWVGGQALPSHTSRCTWAACTIRNSTSFKANIQFYSREEFDNTRKKLYENVFGDENKYAFPLPKGAGKDEIKNQNEYEDIEDLSTFWKEIEPKLGSPDLVVNANSITDLQDKIRPYASRIGKTNSKYGAAYSVKQVDIGIPLDDSGLIDFAIDDLPGTDAPGKRAEEITFTSIKESADVIVFLKNASANGSLNRNETAIWREAIEADESVDLNEKLFIVMTHADADRVEFSDAHEDAAKNFHEDRNVPKSRIFFCSSQAELYDSFKKGGSKGELSFGYSDEKYNAARKKVGGYFEPGTPTTGFPEFKDALYRFLKEDFPGLEARAFNALKKDFEKTKGKVLKILEACDAADADQSVSAEIYQRFTAEWRANDYDGLGSGIHRKVYNTLRDSKPKLRQDFLEKIRKRILESKERIIEGTTSDGLRRLDLAVGTPQQNLPKMRTDYFNERQTALKKEISSELAPKIFINVTEELRELWKSATQVTTPQAPQGMAAISETEQEEFMQKKLGARQASLLRSVFHAGNDESEYSRGFGVLLKSIASVPADYLLIDTPNDDPYRIQLLQKAQIYKDIVVDEKARKILTKARDSHKEDLAKDKVRGLKSMIDDDDKIADIVLNLTFAGTFKDVAAKILHDIKKQNKPRNDDWSNPPDVRSQPAGQNEPLTEEGIIKEIKERVELFYFILEAMLFDQDFGFIGYYFSILEDFRLELVKEIELDGGVIMKLAFKHFKQIWPDVKEFKSDTSRQDFLGKLALIKQLLA